MVEVVDRQRSIRGECDECCALCAVHPVWEVNEKGEWSIKGGGRWLVPVVDLGEGNG